MLRVRSHNKKKSRNVFHFLLCGGAWIFPKSLWRLVAAPAPGPAAAVGKVASAFVKGWLSGAAGVAPPSAGLSSVSSTAAVMVSAAAATAAAAAGVAAAAAAATVGPPLERIGPVSAAWRLAPS
jgi:hypothetical protein